MSASLVIDTNVALDLLVFSDPATKALRAVLLASEVTWLASAEMRAELVRVLEYPKVAPHLVARNLTLESVMAEFDQFAHMVEPAPAATCNCADADDQLFIDLAVHHGALLLSKDAAVLALGRSMQKLGARVLPAWPA